MAIKGRNKFLRILILGLLTAIGPFSIDMYLPGFPAIAKDLHTTVAHITLSLSSFFIGISAGQLLYGPLLDRYGRKKPLYFGISLYLISSVACAVCTSADMLITLRLFQALGGCVGMVAARAMVRDLFPVEEIAKIFSMLMLVVGVSPLIAPTLGGYVTATLGWHYVFVILAVMAALLLAAVHFFMPESRKPDPTVSLRPVPIAKSFLAVLKVPQFYTYAFTGAIAAAGLYAYIAGSPYVFMELFKVTEQQYGWIFAGVALCLIIASQINSVLLRRYKSEQIIRVALLCQAAAGLTLFAGTYFHWLRLDTTILFIAIFLCCQGFSFPNSSALSMAPFSKNAGTASALMGAIQLAIGTLSSALVSILTDHSALPMTGVMALCACISFAVLLAGRGIIRYKVSVAAVQEEAAEMISSS
jgi:DHA1 family bicyclomycin/chloramphenicol resistance-like MFS transporter